MKMNELLQVLSSFEDVKCLFKPSSLDNLELNDVIIDSRKVENGCLFIAIQGETLDGHEYVNDAFTNGAFVCLVEKEGFYNGLCIKVPSTKAALSAIAKYYRNLSNAFIIGITGSAGKTTTRATLEHVLSKIDTCVVASKESFNNDIGVPLSLMKLKQDTAYGIFEVGMNQVGEIAPLSRLLSPNLVIITNVAEAHVGNLGSINAIVQEKIQIINGMSKDGFLILPADSFFASWMWNYATDAGYKNIATFGENEKATTRLIRKHENYETGKTNCLLSVEGQSLDVCVPLLGHYINVALISFSVGKLLGLDLKKIETALQSVELVSGRGKRHTISLDPRASYTLIDDAYNANPASMRASLEMFSKLSSEGRRILILGDMLELGEESQFYHESLKELIERSGASLIFTVGKWMKFLHEVLEGVETKHFETVENIQSILSTLFLPNDLVLIKGSKGSKVHQLANTLIRQDTLKKESGTV